MSDAIRRLSLLNIHIMGWVIVLVCAVGLYFGPIKHTGDDIQATNSARAAAEDAGGTQEKVATQETAFKEAVKRTTAEKAKWQIDEAQYMPKLDLSDPDLLKTYEFKLIKMPDEWGRWLEAWYDAQHNLGITRPPGVDFPVAAFSTNPNDIAQIQSLRFPQTGAWSVTVLAKSFDDAMAHLRRFKSMHGHGVPVIDGVTLTGESPELQLNYNLALYIITSSPPPAADASISAGGGTTGAAGGIGAIGAGGIPGGAPAAGGETLNESNHHGRGD